jgi:tryptophanyl-tRNA synthetase
MNQAKPTEIENLFTLMKVVSTPDTVEYFDDLYNRCQIRYGDMKKQLAEDMVNFTEPFRQRIAELSGDTEYLTRVMKQGAEKARESASKTLTEVRRTIGFIN